MSNLIAQIIELSGDLPDETKYRRYLATLGERELLDKHAALSADRLRRTAERTPQPYNFRRQASLVAA